MIATAVLFVVAMYGAGTSATTLQCQTPAACRCTLPVTGEIDEHWHEQCNMCSILGISSDCPAETQWDSRSFQIGFWAPHSPDVTAETVAVVKIVKPGTDVENPHLIVRGFNTPTLQGCGRSTYPVVADDLDWLDDPTPGLPTAKRETWAMNSASWNWGDNGEFTEPTTVCAPENRIWFFLVTVRASMEETNPTNPVDVYFELKTTTTLYVSQMKVPLMEMTMNAGLTSEFQTRSLYPIHKAQALPFVLVLLPKLFDIQMNPYPTASSLQLPFAGAFTSNAIPVSSETICTVRGVNNVGLVITLAQGCGGNSAPQHIAFGNSITVAPTQAFCSFTLSEMCRPGWETSNAISCTRCLPGHVKAAAGAGQCTQCPVATFMNHSGQTECYPCRSNQGVGQTICVQCEPLQAAVPNMVPTQCECSAGHTLSNTGVCEMCAYGKFKQEVSNDACTACDAGKYGNTQGANDISACQMCPSSANGRQTSEPASVDITACVCTAGHQASSVQHACDLCSSGTAKAVAGNQACTMCDSTSIANGAGNSHCTPCPSGTVAEFDHTSCSAACESNAGPSDSGDCVCNKGYTTATTAASCTQCVAGKYKSTTGNNACVSCIEGKYIANAGADSDTCGFCQNGSYPTLNSAATACTTCPSGSGAEVGSNTKLSDCKCSPGYAGSDGAPCVECMAGKFKTVHGSSACTSCVHGKYLGVAGSAADTCDFCQSGSYPTLNIAATACTTCASGSITETDRNLNITGCKCPPGYEGDASAGVTCSACLAGKFKTDLGGSAGCVLCASNSHASQAGAAACVVCGQGQAGAADRKTCVCAADFGLVTATAECTQCVDPFYKWEIGTAACSQCLLPAILNMTAKTCSDPADVTVTQEVILKAGKNYISFYVFTGDVKVVDIFNQDKQEWANAVLYMKGVGNEEAFETPPNGTKFPSRTRKHAKSNTYILVVNTVPSIPNPVLTVRGKLVNHIADISLQISDRNWLPALSDVALSNRGVLPIRADCPGTVAAVDCHALRYVQRDSVKFFPYNSAQSVVASIGTGGSWSQLGNIKRGNVMRLTLIETQSRPSGTQVIYAQIDSTLLSMQGSSYATASRRSSIFSSSSPYALEPQTTRRLLSIESQTTPQYCGTHVDCQCKVDGIVALRWPLHDCNRCVQDGNLVVCNGMGSAMEDAAMTFVVRIQPPAHVTIYVNADGASNVIGVAKLKRSFPVAQGGVQFEHINIRSARYAFCGGCNVPASQAAAAQEKWGYTFCSNCAEANKLFLISLPMHLLSTEVKSAGDTTALTVNFEFDIAGVLYVTDHHEKLRTEMVGTNTFSKIDIYERMTLEVVPKLFEIRCPLDYSLLQATPALACPFEGVLPANVVIDSATVSALPVNSANYETAGEFRTRYTLINGQRTAAQPERLYYTMVPTGAQVLHITIAKATFDTCERAGVYKTNAAGTASCDPAATNQLPKTMCSDSQMYTTAPITQNDVLYITHFGSGNAVRSAVTYDMNNTLSGTRDFVLNGDQERLEIELLLDGNECVNSKNEISITMHTTPVMPNRFSNMGTSVAVCPDPYTTGCACEVQFRTGPLTILPWPWDECNGCVLIGSASSCNGMGTNFEKEVGISYNLYVENMPVTSTSIVVAKLKKSFAYDPMNPTTSGVQYEHLSIRGKAMPECMGCFGGVGRTSPQWGANFCGDCVDANRIFFFTFLMTTTPGEIVQDSVPGLPVNFEFWVDGVIYVTRTTKALTMLPGGRTVHNNYDTSVVPVQWPQKVDLHEKLFEVICPVRGNYGCPFEGDAPVALLLQSSLAVAETSGNHIYTFRTTANKALYFKLPAFNFKLCSAPGLLYDYCDPDHANYQEEFVAEYCQGDDKYVTKPTNQNDKLVIKFYSTQSGTETYTALPSAETHPAKEWAMTGVADHLEVQFTTDGNTCNADDFSIRLDLSTSPIVDTVCGVGTVGPLNGPCVACKAGEYNAVPGSTTCSICPVQSTSIVGSANVSQCTCEAGYTKQNAADGVSFTCVLAMCDVNAYREATGSMLCQNCPQYASSIAGSSAITNCSCNADYATVSGAGTMFTCAKCAVSQYLSAGTTRSCLLCPGNSTGPTESTSITGCKCNAGFDTATGASGMFSCTLAIVPCVAGSTGAGGAQCNLCETGKYKDAAGPAACQPCPIGSFGPVAGGTNPGCQTCGTSEHTTSEGSSVCVCNPGFFRSGTTCQTCVSGTAKNGYGDETCTSCNTNGAANFVATSDHTECECGKGHTGGNCEPCATGTYKDVVGVSACSRCLGNRTSSIGSFAQTSCVCDLGFGGNDCLVCGAGTYKATTTNGVCTPCIPNSMSLAQSTTEVSCVCLASQGWSATTFAVTRACEQSIQVTAKIFQIPVALNAFIADTNNIRTSFKEALAEAYAVTVNNVTLSYFATGTTQPVYQGRRRRALLTVNTNTGLMQVESCVVEATITTFASIQVPTNDVVLSKLQKVVEGIVLHTSAASLPNNTGFLFDLSLPWFIVFLGLVCMCLICFVALLFVCCCRNRGADEGEWEFGADMETDVASARLIQGHEEHRMPHARVYAHS